MMSFLHGLGVALLWAVASGVLIAGAAALLGGLDELERKRNEYK